MALQKTEAIILRSINHGETSKILNLYSRSRGKITVMAKGARSIRSRFGGTLETLNYVSLLYYEKENRDIQIVSQVDLLAGFSRLKADLERTAFGLAVCELINQLEVGQESNPLLFRLVHSALTQMNASAGEVSNIFRAFQLHLFDIMGFRPHFETCTACGIVVAGTAAFDLQEGGLLCQQCRREETAVHILHSETIAGLQTLQKVHLSKLGDALPGRTAQNQVDSLLRAYLSYHVEGVKELKSLQFLNKVR